MTTDDPWRGDPTDPAQARALAAATTLRRPLPVVVSDDCTPDACAGCSSAECVSRARA